MNCISFALYENKRMYCLGAVMNAILTPQIYPGWKMLCYYDSTVPQPVIDRLKAEGCDVQDMSRLGWQGAHRMLWRFLAADPASGYERMISRDADSRLTMREKWSVDQWLESGSAAHAMRDSISHMCIKMMGGMVGFVCEFPGIEKMMSDYLYLRPNRNASGQVDSYGTDQDFLNTMIWPLVKEDILCHDSFPVPYEPGQGHCGCPHGPSTDEIEKYGMLPLLDCLGP